MTTREMHLEFEQSLQQVAAHITRKYLPEEKDWILNKMYNRFVQSKISPKKDGSGGFEVNQLAADSIRTLIVNTELPAYIDPSKNRYAVILPADYAYLLSDWSYTNQLCNGIEPEVVSTTFPLYALQFRKSTKGSANYYTTLVSQMPTTVDLVASLPPDAVYTGFKRVEDNSFLRPYIALKGGYYWERFGAIYRPGYFLQPKYTAGAITPSLVIDSLNVTTTDTVSITRDTHPTPGIFTDNRLTASTKVAGLQTTAFYDTNYYAPISELEGNLLYVYYNDSFTVSKVGISYVRKYNPISLSLGTNCELPEEFHQTICDLAVEYTKGRLENTAGQQLAQNDIENRVIL